MLPVKLSSLCVGSWIEAPQAVAIRLIDAVALAGRCPLLSRTGQGFARVP